MADPVSLGILGGGAALGGLGSGLFGGKAAGKASQAQQQSALMGMLAQLQMFNQTRADLAPFRNIGGGAFGQLGGLYGIGADGKPTGNSGNFAPFFNSPDYKFAYDQGLSALDRSAAARGILGSGGYGRDLQQYGQGLASQQFGNYFNRLLSMSQIGANSAAHQATANLGFGNNISNLFGGLGQAQASGAIGQANAFGSAFGGLGAGLGGLAGLYRPSSYQ